MRRGFSLDTHADRTDAARHVVVSPNAVFYLYAVAQVFVSFQMTAFHGR